ncbi:MAG: hypothetical protein KC421_17115, partial [Anaerolineales bacterium]|nr:hypothetical protein [Anaerolineales bacterium]
MSETENGTPTHPFWTAVSTAADPATYQPQRHDQVIAARLKNGEGETYYVLKQPQTRSYLRLSETDYALWWQMDGRRSIKQLLFYSLRRYRTLPIGHLNRMLGDLRNGRFLTDTPVNLYDQMEDALTQRAPAGRGQKLINAFLKTEVALDGLDDFFTPLYKQMQWLYKSWGQILLLSIILIGGLLFGLLFWNQTFTLTGGSG